MTVFQYQCEMTVSRQRNEYRILICLSKYRLVLHYSYIRTFRVIFLNKIDQVEKTDIYGIKASIKCQQIVIDVMHTRMDYFNQLSFRAFDLFSQLCLPREEHNKVLCNDRVM